MQIDDGVQAAAGEQRDRTPHLFEILDVVEARLGLEA